MLYAYVNGEKVLATPKQRGKCPVCEADVTSVCSPMQYKINHWRHLAKDNCDPWKGGETQWHLDWKSKFPKECCEVLFRDDETQERHIADVSLTNGVVIEFQNSPLSQIELDSRINFYKKLIWVVNGLTSGFVKPYFEKNLVRRSPQSLIFDFQYWGRSKFFVKWVASKAPVFIDFGTEHLFWLKSFNQYSKKGHVQIVDKLEFVKKYCSD